MRKKITSLLLVVLILLYGCTSKEIKPNNEIRELPDTKKELVQGELKENPNKADKPEQPIELTNAIEAASYMIDYAYNQNKANTLYSPLSLNMALGLANAGAAGNTREQLNKILFNDNFEDYASEYMNNIQRYNVNTSEEFFGYKTRFEIANSVWLDNDYEIGLGFENIVKNKFNAQCETVDFAEAEETCEKVNNWVNEKTYGLIKEILKPQLITLETMATLVNSVYFESAWIEPWDYTDGYNIHKFKNIDGSETETSLMSKSEQIYYKTSKVKAFETRYLNGMSFIGVLPNEDIIDENNDFSIMDLNIEEILDANPSNIKADVKMPKFSFENDISCIIPVLQSMGCTDAFDQNLADFSNMAVRKTDGTENIYISDIIQKCRIELDENGTKAAAVTAIMMNDAMAMRPPKTIDLTFDRPFAFIIYDSHNNEIVFLGKVVSIE